MYLTFYVGIQGSGPVTNDGAEFDVVLRDSNRVLANSANGLLKRALFKTEWRKHRWSTKQYVPLSPFKNTVVDLSFETHGISVGNDLAAWGEPKLEKAFVVTLVNSTGGTVAADPTGPHALGEDVGIDAVPSSGFAFDHWEMTGGITVDNFRSVSTLLHATAAGTISPKFARVLRISSEATQDGWVLELRQNQNAGGSIDATATNGAAIRVGDSRDPAGTSPQYWRQYMGVVSFNVPDLTGTTIRSAKLKTILGGVVGVPTTALGTIVVDWAVPTFNASALEITDFEATATYSAISTLSVPSLSLDTECSATIPVVDVASLSLNQGRLRFTLDDNNDNNDDYLGFYSGETSAKAPVLELIVYP